MNRAAFEELNIPITVKRGILGKLEVKIPWTSLSTDPTVVVLEDICLLVVPKEASYDEDYKKREEETKNGALQIFQLAREEIYEAPKEAPTEKKGFVDKMMEKVVRNVRIEIKNIHIRYEDDLSISGVTKLPSFSFHKN